MGGGFVVGGLDSLDDICAELCAQTGYRVVAVDYRLCPEHVHPAAAATRWVGRSFWSGTARVANLAAAVAHHARGETDRIRGQVLIYPDLGGGPDTDSYVTHANAPMLTRDEVIQYTDIRHGGPVPLHDPTASPLVDQDFANVPSHHCLYRRVRPAER